MKHRGSRHNSGAGGGGGTFNPSLPDDATAAETQGAVTEGDTIGQYRGLSISDMLAKVWFPPENYNNPSLGLLLEGQAVNANREVGSTQIIDLVATFNQQDAGPLNNLQFTKNGVSVQTGGVLTTYQETLDVTVGSTAWRAIASYDAGTTKPNHTGSPPTAGSVNSSIRNLVGIYPFLTGSDASNALTGTALYNALTKSVTTQGNKSIAFSFAGEYGYFAYPEDYPNLSSIIDQNGFNVTAAWSQDLVSVTSTGLGTNYTKTFKVYTTNNVTSINGTFQFNF